LWAGWIENQRLVHVHKKSELLALLQPCYEREMVEGLVEVQLALEEMVDVAHRGKKVLPCHGLLELTHTARN
jgi:hypothetical protein